MIHTLAHNPEAIMTAILSAVVLVLVGTPVLYSMLSAFAFMLSGIGAGVSWCRRLTAPAASLLGGFLCVGLTLLWLCAGGNAGEEAPLWVEVAKYVTFFLWLLIPLPVCRILLKFSWWRSLLATLLVPLLHGMLAMACLWGLGAMLGKDVTETPAAPETAEMPADDESQSE